MSALARVALLEAILKVKKLRPSVNTQAGLKAIDAIDEALCALRGAADQISAVNVGMECIADQLHDMATDVAAYYAEPVLTELDHARNRADHMSKMMREDAA